MRYKAAALSGMRRGAMGNRAARTLAGILVVGTLLVALTAHAQTPTPLPEATLLSVAKDYVKVFGAVITGLGTLFGLPLVFQTFRKTRAEIMKINLESEKLRKELVGTAQGTLSSVEAGGHRIVVDGNGNTVSIMTDPKWAAPVLVLVDAFIASVFSTVASYAVGFLPLPYFVIEPMRLIIYLAIFYPVFRAARDVKKNLGMDIHQPLVLDNRQ